MNAEGLDQRLLAAHAGGAPVDLAGLYREAADLAEREGDVTRACFFLTHAWVYALEAGDDLAKDLRARLVAHGRETET